MLCAGCGSELRVVRNGVKVRYGYYSGYFNADLLECPNCKYRVLANFGSEIFDPEAEADFDFSERMGGGDYVGNC